MKAKDILEEMKKNDGIQNINVECGEFRQSAVKPSRNPPHNDKITVEGNFESDEGLMVEVYIKGRQTEFDKADIGW